MCEITASRENTPLGATSHTPLMVDAFIDGDKFHARTTARKRTRRERRRERHIG